jgi:hypothetical protein
MGNEISESGWTMYLDQSFDSWSNKISNEFDFHEQYTQPTKYQTLSIVGYEVNSSMASVASFRP